MENAQEVYFALFRLLHYFECGKNVLQFFLVS